MSNKYASIVRTYRIRNLYEDTLTPGTDVIIPASGLATNNDFRTFQNFSFDSNTQTNFTIKRLGLFSNFADGLVWKNAADRISVLFSFSAYRFAQSYSIDLTYGAKGVTTAGTTGWVAGDRRAIAVFDGPRYVLYVDPTGANAGNLEDYWSVTTGTVDASTLALVGRDISYVYRDISTLNCMHEVNQFAEPFNFGSGNDFDIVAVHIAINATEPADTPFLTNIIDASFTDETVYFDVVADIEFTGADA